MMKDLEKETFLYHHPISTKLMICFKSQTELFAEIKITKLQPSKNTNIEKTDLLQIEAALVQKIDELKELKLGFLSSNNTFQDILTVTLLEKRDD